MTATQMRLIDKYISLGQRRFNGALETERDRAVGGVIAEKDAQLRFPHVLEANISVGHIDITDPIAFGRLHLKNFETS